MHGTASEAKMQKGGKGFMFEGLVGKKKGFGLVEAVMVVLFISILAVVTVPRLNLAVISKHKAEATAKKIVTDLRRARRLAISDAATNEDGFGIEMIGSNPYTGYTIVNEQTDVSVDSHTIDSAINCTGDSPFTFGPLGNLISAGSSQLVISASGKSFTITVTAATGVVECTEN
jgi:Tfp pilus assembly protein FimT